MKSKVMVNVKVDRPKGYRNELGTVYPINYGLVTTVLGGDGEPQDAYVISKTVTKPLTSFYSRLVAIIHRHDDVEMKWVVTAVDEQLSYHEILTQTHFLEQYFDSEIELLN